VLDWHRCFIIRKVLVDPYQMASMLQRLKRAHVPIEEFKQSPANLTSATATLIDQINAKKLVLYEDDGMRLAASRAIIEVGVQGMRLDKDRTRQPGYHIDVIVALAMAVYAAVHGQNKAVDCNDPLWERAWIGTPDDPDGSKSWQAGRLWGHIIASCS
jgi:phage terminase large subunit-like protein